MITLEVVHVHEICFTQLFSFLSPEISMPFLVTSGTISITFSNLNFAT